MEPWAGTSMYHALGISVFAFLEAILTFEQVTVLLCFTLFNNITWLTFFF